MKLQVGDMWSAYNEADLFLFAANSILDKNLCLVMGAGIARQVKQRFPTVPADAGFIISKTCGSGGEFFLIPPTVRYEKIGAFQVKHHWRTPADLGLIERSTTVLWWWAMNHSEQNIHLNYPGIGNGRLTVEQVEPIISVLPDNVTVWRYK